jgi:Poxvirus A32 protein
MSSGFIYSSTSSKISFLLEMEIKEHDISLPVINHDCVLNPNQLKKHVLFNGSSKRCLIVGSSGSGKTNALLSLLEHPNGLRFENIYLYSKSLYQPKYDYLRLLMEPLNEIGYFEYSDSEEIVHPTDIKPNSIIIFDDLGPCNSELLKNYFCFGRHKNTDCFFLCQTYSAIPKQLIRDNANLLIIFQQDMTNLKHIYDDHVSVDMSFQKFKETCGQCWNDKYGFVVIDKDCPIDNGRYRKGFDKFIQL